MKGKHNFMLSILLFIYCFVVTVVYLTVKDPLFHECAYALMVFTTFGSSLRIIWKYAHKLHLFVLSNVLYGVGFIIWNIDNIFCDQLRQWRSDVGYPLKPLLQGHSWWHMLSGTGAYLGVIFCTHARAKLTRRRVSIETYGLWPLVFHHSKDKRHDSYGDTH